MYPNEVVDILLKYGNVNSQYDFIYEFQVDKKWFIRHNKKSPYLYIQRAASCVSKGAILTLNMTKNHMIFSHMFSTLNCEEKLKALALSGSLGDSLPEKVDVTIDKRKTKI